MYTFIHIYTYIYIYIYIYIYQGLFEPEEPREAGGGEGPPNSLRDPSAA